MAKVVAVIASTHHPFYYRASTATGEDRPPFADEWVAKIERFRETLTRARPDVLVMVGSDHFHQLWLDNMPSWEYGVVVQVRDFSRALRKDFARSQSQSTEDGDLARAEPNFNFDNRSWALPSTESRYREGIDSLDRYLARLSEPGQSGARFYTRADNLNNWFGDVATRLGSLSQRLSASVGQVRLNTDVNEKTELAQGQVPEVTERTYETPWLQIDNVFYEARGQAWALSHLLRAIEVDFADVLAKKNATVSVRQIIRELEAAQATLWSPMVLNGSGYGILANHSLVMANYISRANAAVIDLRQLLSQG